MKSKSVMQSEIGLKLGKDKANIGLGKTKIKKFHPGKTTKLGTFKQKIPRLKA